MTVQTKEETLCLSPLEAKTDESVVNVVGVEKCRDTKQVMQIVY